MAESLLPRFQDLDWWRRRGSNPSIYGAMRSDVTAYKTQVYN